ncbi:hypothetical protein ACT16_20020 [Mycobacterium heckeshornense]|nr:hypothetical protein ACT16_20020 [Mycobacterium heckeshornense]
MIDMILDWPLCGRDGELAQLREILSRNRAGAVIAGEAGVGKTRLAQEFLALPECGHHSVIRIAASRAARQIPLGAFAAVLPAVHHRQTRGFDERTDLMRRLVAGLLEVAAGRRLLLSVDDAHLLDDVSATLVHQFVVSGSAFVLATLRPDQTAPDPVVALWKDGLLDRLDLSGLDADAISMAVSSALRGPVDPTAIADLASRCQGNALFLRELVLGAVESAALIDDGGIWHFASELHPSGRLAELVDARLGEVAPAERSLLELLAFADVIGSAELDELSDPAVAERLERKGLVTARLEGRGLQLRLAHPLYGDVVRARIPTLRRRAIVRSLAEVVESRGARRREDVLRVATWRLDVGGASPELMMEAATMARWRYDFPLAARLAQAAIRAGAGFKAELLAAQVASLQGRAGDAEKRLAALARHATSDSERAPIAIARLDNYLYYLGQTDQALAVAEDAYRTIRDPIWRNEITAKRAGLLLATDGPEAAAAAAVPLLHEAKERALVWGCVIAGYSLGRLGRIEEALKAAGKGFEANLALNRPLEWYPWYHLFHRAEALAHAGRFADAQALSMEQYHTGVADRSPEAQAFFAWQICKRVGEQGHVTTSIQYGCEAALLFRQLDRPQFLHYCLGYLALAYALAGEPEKAHDALAELDALGLPANYFMGVDLLQTRAWVALARGEVRVAHRLLEEAAKVGQDIGDFVGAAAALHGLARLGAAEAAALRLSELSGRIEGQLAATRAAHACSLASCDAPGLEEAARAFEAMGADLLGAEAAADAATAWQQAGEPHRAARVAAWSRPLVTRCEGAVTPALQSGDLQSRLTPSEWQTALLAAAGRSNKEIATGLCLSVRTVESYLQAVYEKLGISSRGALAGLLSAAP